MKTKFLLMFLFLILIILSGCSKQPDKIYITKYKIITLQPPKSIYQDDVNIPVPASKYRYVEANPIQRERILTKYIIDLLGVIKKYKIKLSELNNWYIDANKAVVSTRGK